MTQVAADGAARHAIAHDLDATLFVEAGAGTGKTTSLVGRIVSMVTQGKTRLSQIAAITFTEAAAAELRERIREALAQASTGTSFAAVYARQGLEDLPGAAITTLHGFARRILVEHPFAAGLPASVEVLDELHSDVSFDERWRGFLDELLASERVRLPLLRLLAAGVRLDRVRDLAFECNQHWDLLADARLDPAQSPPVGIAALRDALERVLGLTGHCTDPDDHLLRHIEDLRPFADRLGAVTSELAAVQLLAQAPPLASGRGRKERWLVPVADVREELRQVQAILESLYADVTAGALGELLVEIRRLTLRGAAERRERGQLEFHDLLVLARDVVRDHPEVRDALAERYEFLYVDEFQDTDPLQAELVVRLAAPGAAPDTPWTELVLRPGRVFFVGDPKQSIYRFRRADISVFLDARGRYVDEAHQLSHNFRSVPGVLSWINAVFSELLGDGVVGMQPAFVPLAAQRGGSDLGRHPVIVLGGAVEAAELSTAELREREADETAALLRLAADEGWPVGDDRRAVTFSDMALLLPTRTGLDVVLEALDGHGVPYRLETSALVYSSAEVRDLLAVLRCVDDPCNQPATLAALRAPGLGCGDDDLLEFKTAGGQWDYRAGPPEGLPGHQPVIAGMAVLRELHAVRYWREVSTLVEEIIDRLRLRAASLDGARPQEAWRRLQVVAEHARRFDDAPGGGLRPFLAWTDLQTGERARFTDVSVADPDHQAVRIMTIHAAKGLEFPLVAVAGLGVARRSPSGTQVLWGAGGPHVSLVKKVHTPGYPHAAAHESDMEDHERIRLLYVAATRARDHLIVGLYHQRSNRPTLAALLEAANAGDACCTLAALDLPDAAVPADLGSRGVGPRADGQNGADRAAWEEAHARLVARAEKRSVVAATGVAHLDEGGEEPIAEEAEEEAPEVSRAATAWRRGRAGTAVGRAVHAVLQVADLSGNGDVAAQCANAAAVEGVASRAAEVAGLVRQALASEPIHAAVASGRFWRELYVGVPVGPGAVLEGYVDLLVETPQGLWVVDYKTDRVDGDDAVEAAMGRYRLQGAAYAVAVERAVGRPVERMSFLFLTPQGALVRDLSDLVAGKEQVVGRLTAA
jgi:ATP-dependent helicase/nuclease subunit A